MNEPKYKNLKLYISSSDSTGCGYYRSKWPSDFLKQSGYSNVRFNFGFPIQDRLGHEWSDVIIAQRINHEHFLKLIPYLKSIGKKFALDMDDCIWEIPRGNLARQHYPQNILDRMAEIVSLCDVIICSTEPLAHYISKWNKNIFISPNMIHTVYPFREDHGNSKFKIGWAGSYTHAFEFPEPLSSHLKMLNKYEKIQSVVFGFDGKLPKQPNREIPDLFKFSEKHSWVDCENYVSYLNDLNFDLGYAVVDRNIFNECKSNIKFLEYSSCSVPMVAAASFPYTNTIINGKTGFVVNNDRKEWKDYINLLMEDKNLRNEIKWNAWNFVKDNFTYEYAGYKTLKVYEQIFDFLYEGKTEGMWKNYDVDYYGKV